MSFNLVDFVVGAFIANAVAHFVIGAMDIRFLSLFGFSPKQNVLYSLWNVAVAIGVSLYFYGYQQLLNNSYVLGGLFVLFAYGICGRSLYLRWRR